MEDQLKEGRRTEGSNSGQIRISTPVKAGIHGFKDLPAGIRERCLESLDCGTKLNAVLELSFSPPDLVGSELTRLFHRVPYFGG